MSKVYGWTFKLTIRVNEPLTIVVGVRGAAACFLLKIDLTCYFLHQLKIELNF